MLKKRIIVCLDVKDGRTTKGVKFQNNIDIGDPVEMAKEYYKQGVDELVFYDIIASARGRGPILELISQVASQVFIPFCVGGGIGSIEDIRSTILAGAEKVSLNSQAVKNPGLITEGARIFGNQCIVLGMDAAKDEQRDIEARIEELEKILKNAEIVVEDDVDLEKINIGCTVDVYDREFEEEMEFKIVGSTEANSLAGKISNESPVGRALIGKKVGDVVAVETQAGVIEYEVLKINRSI